MKQKERTKEEKMEIIEKVYNDSEDHHEHHHHLKFENKTKKKSFFFRIFRVKNFDPISYYICTHDRDCSRI